MVRPVKRAYDTSRRQAQARETQRHIAEAARELFIERGYVATSIRDVAQRAGVSVQTIYNAFEGGKAAIFHRVMDIVIVGDDEPRAMAERPEFQAMFQTRDPKKLLSIGVGLSVALYGRMKPLIPAIRAAVVTDPTVAEAWEANYGQARYTGTTPGMARLAQMGALRSDVDVTRATDITWTVLSLDNYEALVVERGWTPEAYAAWALDALVATLLKGR
jgi:TetR/AcrR family transcriptional regulator, regulator of autoinduction and epiphytic fitness